MFCASTTSCFAVGTDGTHALAEHWDGVSWSTMTTPNPFGDGPQQAARRVVPTATGCFAVGSYERSAGSSDTKAFVEHWNGKAWSVMRNPKPGSSVLSGVSCPRPGECFAVGGRIYGLPLIEHWDGYGWSVVRAPYPKGSLGYLEAVSCPSFASCFAVGEYAGPSSDGLLYERWDGARWSIVPSPDPGP